MQVQRVWKGGVVCEFCECSLVICDQRLVMHTVFLGKIVMGSFTLVIIEVLFAACSFAFTYRENDAVSFLRKLGIQAAFVAHADRVPVYPQQIPLINHNCPKWFLNMSHSLREHQDEINAAGKLNVSLEKEISHLTENILHLFLKIFLILFCLIFSQNWSIECFCSIRMHLGCGFFFLLKKCFRDQEDSFE